jgi:lipid-A-disaccharide synthase-like uncharacterized protein
MDHGIGYFIGHLFESLQHAIAGASASDMLWLGIGIAGQLLFMARFIVQWIHSERHGKSLIPVSFWYLSLSGGLIVLAYGVHKLDPVIILGQLPGAIVYTRNLMLIKRNAKQTEVEIN